MIHESRVSESDAFSLPPRLAELAKDLPHERLRFEAVPVRGRSDGWTAARQKAFIVRLALCGSVNAAAEAVGMTRRSAYKLRERAGADDFVRAWEAALDCGRRGRRDHAIEHALLGEVRPVFYRGRRCGEQVRFSTGLTIAVLNAMTAEQESRVVEKTGFSSNDSGTFGNFRTPASGRYGTGRRKS